LNDAYTFKTNQSSSLWDSNNQCKPAFYAVARVGIYYNKLDSLISFADSLKQSEYTSESWSELAATLDSAKSVMNQNFSFTVSADTALSTAENNLETAVNGLVKIATYVNVVKENNPKTFSLSQNYPNPFNPTTRIKYSVPQDGYISLKVYNLLGQEVTKIFEGFQHAGSYVILFDGSKLASGVYLYQLKANNYLQTRKLILLK
jgi:hypothetical protein